MIKLTSLTLSICLAGISCAAQETIKHKPNIVFIMSDDQGVGDVSSFHAGGKIKTPHIDSLCREGMMFTDAHSASSVCTPTRYGLLTGRYPWRTTLQSGVLQTQKLVKDDGTHEVGTTPLIAPETLNVAQFLKQNGYSTAVIGKWHLGFHYDLPKGSAIKEDRVLKDQVPIGATIPDGPITRGFDLYKGFHHAGEMRTWIEQDRVVANLEHPDEMLEKIASSSVDYIHSQKGKAAPFFLYVPLNSPHGPTVPSVKWQGRSGINAYADYVMETDDAVGRILAALEKSGLTENTLVVFTSDNGCSRYANFKQLEKFGHDPSAGFRGAKMDSWEGGSRVPYVAKWPGHVKPMTTCDEAICHNSLIRTCADILGVDLPSDQAVDSFSILPLLLGEEGETHPLIITASYRGDLSIRRGAWKLILHTKKSGKNKGPLQPLLYQLDRDKSEQNNLAHEKSELTQTLTNLLVKSVNDGFTVPGKSGTNDVEVLGVRGLK